MKTLFYVNLGAAFISCICLLCVGYSASAAQVKLSRLHKNIGALDMDRASRYVPHLAKNDDYNLALWVADSALSGQRRNALLGLVIGLVNACVIATLLCRSGVLSAGQLARRSVMFLLLSSTATAGILWIVSYAGREPANMVPGGERTGKSWSFFMQDDSSWKFRIAYGSAQLFHTSHGPPVQTDVVGMGVRTFAGFKRMFSVISGDVTHGFAVPFWFLVVAFAAYPVVAFIRGPLRRRRRLKRNQCAICGYSLIGLPTRKCPECGHCAHNPENITL